MLRRILYIDDDEGICTLVQRALERLGVEVVCTRDARAGLAMLANGDEFEAIALDNYMPVMDGLATLAEIRKIPNHPPVIFVTGAQDSTLAVKALKAGAFDYVVKDIQGEFIALLMNGMQTAVNAMLIVNELVVNAIKYAYPGSSGPIRVILKKLDGKQVAVTVEDDGVGSEDSTSAHSGLGSRIVKAMAQKIDGTLTRDSDHRGTRVTVVFPL